ncbi:MAG: phosphoribosylaminoimidazolecarboxamide formyltransferase / cyclohydrolase [Chloroflexota bacterium]|jgi:phosphoribosylaminoimidazolecarboxamide formyltransferase/IMP cyclohydrolase|nr:phosphoribosylaminoimidazolecarboxamide formyltransferase / cyclohydrolase [Chloroflexota bacterium]
MADAELTLRYGINPHQAPARIYRDGPLPTRVRNGSPGYINLLDALNSWQLVCELRQVLDLPAAASFKHVSPAGAAVGLPMDERAQAAYLVDDLELSPLATAYARARSADRVSSFGDWVALSDPMDVETARLIRREVSDGVIAPGFAPEALEILKKKQGGNYRVVEIDPGYRASEIERRDVFGITFEQRRNGYVPALDALGEAVTARKELPADARRDLAVAQIALKYTQSNSTCLAVDGQVIGMGAGQQSRIHCTRLAASKADLWWLRQHPAVAELRFKPKTGRTERDNAIDQFLRDDLTPTEISMWEELFETPPRHLSAEEKRAWLDRLQGVSMGSDAFIPFRDNIDRAATSGVRYVAQPGGSVRDEDVIHACDEYGMVMIFTGVRLFHH